MTKAQQGWVRVSHKCPCPICGKPDNCTVSDDGTMVWCGRVSDESLRQNKGGQYLHRLAESPDRPQPRPVQPPPRRKAPERPTNFEALVIAWERSAESNRQELARQLGVSPAALSRLRCGWCNGDQLWSFPEKNGTGQIIGVSTRSVTGEKKRLRGSKTGLTYAADWNCGSGPILLVEGASDTAALMTLGLNVVGRPSNFGGVPLLCDLLRPVSEEQPIIVIAERDQKPDGRWPGKDGAVSVAEQLSTQLNRCVAWSLPPDDAKDARAWLNQNPDVERNGGQEFLEGLHCEHRQPPVVIEIPPDDRPVVDLTDWRSQMLRARLASLDQSGYYLDNSGTGCGKSTVDLHVILHAAGLLE